MNLTLFEEKQILGCYTTPHEFQVHLQVPIKCHNHQPPAHQQNFTIKLIHIISQICAKSGTRR